MNTAHRLVHFSNEKHIHAELDSLPVWATFLHHWTNFITTDLLSNSFKAVQFYAKFLTKYLASANIS